jgi:4-amino-4-deoxy-L-arabinose transferase-like glycosyltransferase
VSRGERLLLVLLGLAIFLPGIGSRDLWNPDEPRYAEVAREMRARGDWFVPHLNGRIYSEKPPLHFWAIAAASTLTGGVTRSRPDFPRSSR